jgi:hypothetical protein
VAFLARVDTNDAEKMREKLIKSFYSLLEMPGRYPFLEEDYIPKNKYHKMVVDSHLLVIYQVRDAEVSIDYVVDCHKDYSWLVR